MSREEPTACGPHDVTAVVVRWRGGEEVERCLASLLEHGGPRLAEIVLVDSGSGDGGAEALTAAFPAVRVMALAENRSFAWAANQGAAEASSQLLLILNPDTRMLPGALDRLAAFLDHRPAAAGAVPLLIGDSGEPQHRWQLRRLPSAFRLAAGLPGRAAFASPPESATPIAQPAAAAWLIRRSVWDALGGLDPVFAPAWWEDVDLCARLQRLLRTRPQGAALPTEGFWVVPGATIEHEGGSSTVHLSDAQLLAIYHGNLLRYAARHHPRSTGVIRCGLTLSLAARALLRPERGAAYHYARRSLP